MTRSSIRSAVLLAASAALTAGLVSGCSAGQVTQTEAVRPPSSGIDIDSADGTINLRDLAIIYKDPAGYPQGGNAPVRVRIINAGKQPVRLVEVAADAGTVVVSAGSAAPSPSPVTPSSAPPSVVPSPSGSNGRQSPGPSGSPAAPPSPVGSPPPPPVGNPQINIEIKVDSLVILDPRAARYLQITGLTKGLPPSGTVMMRFRFDNGVTITAPVPVSVSESALPRSPLPAGEGEK